MSEHEADRPDGAPHPDPTDGAEPDATPPVPAGPFWAVPPSVEEPPAAVARPPAVPSPPPPPDPPPAVTPSPDPLDQPPAAAAPPPFVEVMPAEGRAPDRPVSDVNGSPSVVRARPRRAVEFTDQSMLRPQGQAPARGWRRVLFSATGGRVQAGPSTADQRAAGLLERVRAPVDGCRRVLVLSRKGGVGKTTTTLLLGHTLAAARRDRVVALDANPDAGNLGQRVPLQTGATVTDLLAGSDVITRYADMRTFTSQSDSRLEVIASDADPTISRALGEAEYRRAVRLLERHYTIVLLDTGTGVLDSATQGLLAMTDQIVLITGSSLDGARAGALTLDWLGRHGFARLVREGVTVVNQARERGMVDLDRIDEHFARRCRTVVRVPADPYLTAGAGTDPERLRPATRQAYLELAAAVADGFSDPPAR